MSEMKRMALAAEEAERERLENTVLDAANNLLHYMGCGAFKLPGRVNLDVVMCVGTPEQIRSLLPAYDEAVALRAHAALGKWVEEAFDTSKTSASEAVLQGLGLPMDEAQMPLSWHINRHKENNHGKG